MWNIFGIFESSSKKAAENWDIFSEISWRKGNIISSENHDKLKKLNIWKKKDKMIFLLLGFLDGVWDGLFEGVIEGVWDGLLVGSGVGQAGRQAWEVKWFALHSTSTPSKT